MKHQHDGARPTGQTLQELDNLITTTEKDKTMGTRGTMAFKHNGQTKSAYNHWDSYPSGLGQQIKDWILSPDRTDSAAKVDALVAIDSSVAPTPEQQEALKIYTDLKVSGQSLADWYCLLRGTQGNPALTLEAGYFEPHGVGEEEWSYVVDFDTATLEVWRGPERVRTILFEELPDVDFGTLEEDLPEEE